MRGSILDDVFRDMQAALPRRGKSEMLAEKARRAFDVGVRLMEFMDDNFPEAEAEELKRRFLSGVKRKSLRKFDIAADEISKRESAAAKKLPSHK